MLRLGADETVVVADGRGGWRECRWEPAESGKAGGTLVVAGPVHRQPAPEPPLTLAFAPVKGDRPEWVVQKLTEIGVDRIVPLATARSIVRWEGTRASRALARLERVAREAAAQSRRVWLPEVSPVQGLAPWAKEAGAVLAEPGGGPLEAGTTVVAVGPEGGWSPGELALGLPTVDLGPEILRAETAALVAAALVTALRAGTVRAPAP